MGIKYYTHFVMNDKPTCLNEFTGVVELAEEPRGMRGSKANFRQIASMLARSLELDSEDIRILHWSRVH